MYFTGSFEVPEGVVVLAAESIKQLNTKHTCSKDIVYHVMFKNVPKSYHVQKRAEAAQ